MEKPHAVQGTAQTLPDCLGVVYWGYPVTTENHLPEVFVGTAVFFYVHSRVLLKSVFVKLAVIGVYANDDVLVIVVDTEPSPWY